MRSKERGYYVWINICLFKEENTAIGAPGLKELLLGNARSYGIYLALVAVIIIFQVLTGNRLLYPNNVVALFQQNAYVMITAIGMLMIVVATHIDLSVGSAVAFIGGLGAFAMKHWGMELDACNRFHAFYRFTNRCLAWILGSVC